MTQRVKEVEYELTMQVRVGEALPAPGTAVRVCSQEGSLEPFNGIVLSAHRLNWGDWCCVNVAVEEAAEGENLYE